MRRLLVSLVVAAVAGTSLAASFPSQANAQYYGGGYYGYDHDGWRERAWREHRWHEWMWRRHMWHERHEGHFDH